jgi:hypothetical protein
VTRYFYLNCAAAASIPANGSFTFQVKRAIPASMQPMSSAKLDWQIQGSTGPARTETIPLDPVFALEGTAASQALCSR